MNEKFTKFAQTFFKIVMGIALLFFILLWYTCKTPPKTKVDIANEKLAIIQAKKDSIQAIRDEKINFALTYLKMQIQKNMKNPDSYEVIDRKYDQKDTLNTVKMYIRFRGDNSFGGKSISRVDAVYDFKKEGVTIVNQSVE